MSKNKYVSIDVNSAYAAALVINTFNAISSKKNTAINIKPVSTNVFLFIMICTGCRISGALNLKREYINQVKSEIYIDEHNKCNVIFRDPLGTQNPMKPVVIRFIVSLPGRY